jgi:hypothetical protein
MQGQVWIEKIKTNGKVHREQLLVPGPGKILSEPSHYKYLEVHLLLYCANQ